EQGGGRRQVALHVGEALLVRRASGDLLLALHLPRGGKGGGAGIDEQQQPGRTDARHLLDDERPLRRGGRPDAAHAGAAPPVDHADRVAGTILARAVELVVPTLARTLADPAALGGEETRQRALL